MEATEKPHGCVQVDLDGIWAIRECYGLPGNEFLVRDPIYEQGVRNFLELFERFKIQATFFVAGRDAEIPEKKEQLHEIVRHGHEIANHSYGHRIGLSRLQRSEIRADIERAQEAIQRAVRITPVGFRAPGYDLSPVLVRELADLGFRYDSSLLPTFSGPVLRMIARYLSGSLIAKRAQYGRMIYGRAPLRPYRINLDRPWREDPRSPLMEIPISVSPLLRLPFHGSVAIALGLRHVERIVASLVRRRLPIIYVFHGIDLVDLRGIDVVGKHKGGRFFYAPFADKQRIIEKILAYLTGHCSLIPTQSWPNHLSQ
jgi:hypothetical protein